MSGDSAYVFDEYVNGTPERQARYISAFRINLATLRTVVGSELAGRVEILAFGSPPPELEAEKDSSDIVLGVFLLLMYCRPSVRYC